VNEVVIINKPEYFEAGEAEPEENIDFNNRLFGLV
jgi:hypothetical protein